MKMSRRKALIFIILLLVPAVALPLLIKPSTGVQTRVVKLKAAKYGYTPAKIVVNQGDRIVIQPTSLDVTHGFYLDGYPVEFTIKQQGLAFQKYTWEDEDGSLQTDWDKVSQIEFVADRKGKFIFRCTRICGNLHPFMTGELIVRPNTFYYLSVSLSVWLVVSMLLWFLQDAATGVKPYKRVNLLETFPLLKWLVKRRSFQFLLLFPGVVVFYLFIIASLWGSPVGNSNIAIIVVWILWWFALKAIFVPLGGRLWCMICPLPAPAEWLSRKSLTAVHYVGEPIRRLHHRFAGLQKDWPLKLRNMWLQNVIFLAMISFGIILITRPVATAILFLLILAATLLLAAIFRHRVFCLYLCPVGGFLGNYSMASMTEIRAIDPDVCRKHKDKCCYSGGENGWACPWNQYIGKMNRNNHCGFCTECIKSCPKDNVGIFARPFGSDFKLKGYDEMYNIIIMLVVAIAFSITMLGPWGFIKDAANITESRQLQPFLLYMLALWGSALAIFPGIFILTVKGARRLGGETVDFRTLTLRLAYILIPVGIFAWIAFSLSSIMINYNYVLNVLSDPLGLGWDLFGTAKVPFAPFIPEWIPPIQGVILLAGLYFGLTLGCRALKTLFDNPEARTKVMILPSLFALGVVNIFLKLYLG
jgi:polyferredoxin